jgi:hypothetical protein
LENERTELKSMQLKIQMMENQMLEKDRIFQVRFVIVFIKQLALLLESEI